MSTVFFTPKWYKRSRTFAPKGLKRKYIDITAVTRQHQMCGLHMSCEYKTSCSNLDLAMLVGSTAKIALLESTHHSKLQQNMKFLYLSVVVVKRCLVCFPCNAVFSLVKQTQKDIQKIELDKEVCYNFHTLWHINTPTSLVLPSPPYFCFD